MGNYAMWSSWQVTIREQEGTICSNYTPFIKQHLECYRALIRDGQLNIGMSSDHAAHNELSSTRPIKSKSWPGPTAVYHVMEVQ